MRRVWIGAHGFVELEFERAANFGAGRSDFGLVH
jgi:hypothetical protein